MSNRPVLAVSLCLPFAILAIAHHSELAILQHIKKFIFSLALISAGFLACAQDSSSFDKAISFPNRFFSALDKKTASIEQKLNKQTESYLNKLQKQEDKLRRKLYKQDSSLARKLFDGVENKYDQLRNMSGNVSKYQNVYSGHLDSLSTALDFLKGKNLAENPELEKTLAQYSKLQQSFNATDQIKKQLDLREQVLKEQFEKLGMIKELKQYREQIYYYQQQIKEYKQTFEDPSKLEEKLMAVAMKFPQFQDFFAKNSLLGSLFNLPQSNASTASVSIAGLQTRAMVNQTLLDRFGSSTAINQQLQQNVSGAQSQISELTDKLKSYSSGSYGNTSDGDIPGFKPNSQKTKTFLKRLEYGGDIQSQKTSYLFPVTSDIAISLGYKINDKSSIGIGAAYKIGWGSSWDHIKITHQGIGLRSYLDWKIKGSFYLSGGYEQNYNALINSISQLRVYSAWQTSGLIGLEKKYSISKKMNGTIKLLWDFLSYQQMPKTQPILFRVGYSLK
jgi:hypothetical protein